MFILGAMSEKSKTEMLRKAGGIMVIIRVSLTACKTRTKSTGLLIFFLFTFSKSRFAAAGTLEKLV